MLESHGQKSVCVDPDFLFLVVETDDLDSLRPFDLGRKVDYAKASLLPNDLAFGMEALGVDALMEHLSGILIDEVANEDALKDFYLSRRQSHPRRRVHDRCHI